MISAIPVLPLWACVACYGYLYLTLVKSSYWNISDERLALFCCRWARVLFCTDNLRNSLVFPRVLSL